jgi:hypothetical protein
VIQRFVQNPLAMWLLEEEVAEGTVVRVGLADSGDALTFEPEEPGERAAPVRTPADAEAAGATG